MSTQITTAFVNQYRDNVEHLLRQEGSKLRMCVRTETQNGEKAYYEQIGDSTVKTKTSRHSKVEYSDTPHARRMVVTEYKYTSDLVDKDDKLRMLIDPTSDYAQSQSDALGLDLDRTILTAAFGTAYTGKEGGTSTAFDSSMVVPVTLQDGAGSSDCSLNVAKIRRASRLLDDEYVPERDRIIIAPPRQKEVLLSSTEITSSDYNSVKALVNGDVNTFMGFKFVWTPLVSSEFTDANSDDRVLFFQKTGMLLAMSKDIGVKMDTLPEYHHATQVYCSLDCGATRMQEKKVGYIICDPTAGITAA
ncbi:MAG: hypothetical protein GY938_26870 [Ketobacter sp.]|nr:hypothetical protein [Ketobacter sp.]